MASRYCVKCGEEAVQGNSFCGGCGQAVPLVDTPAYLEPAAPLPSVVHVCVQCGADLTPGKRFCRNCGHAVDAAASVAATEVVPVFVKHEFPSISGDSRPKRPTAIIAIGLTAALALVGTWVVFQHRTFSDRKVSTNLSGVDQETRPNTNNPSSDRANTSKAVPTNDTNEMGESTSTGSVQQAVSVWVDAFRSKNPTALAASYAPIVEKYFRKEHVSREQVQGYFESAFPRIVNIRAYEVDDIKVDMLPTENAGDGGTNTGRAAATFHKTWETTQTDGKTFSGEEIEKLTFASLPEGWKIVREEELNIIRVSRR